MSFMAHFSHSLDEGGSRNPVMEPCINQVGETTGNEIRPFLKSRIRIPIRLCSLPIHSPCLCLLLAIELCMEIMLGECMRDAQVIN